ncbi:MAG TPA: hypothetical protein VF401_00040 [Candidatus Saccharimonadales bacterium]
MTNYNPHNEQRVTPEKQGVSSRLYKVTLGDFNVNNGILLQFPDIDKGQSQNAPEQAQPATVTSIRPEVNTAVATTATAAALEQDAQQMTAKEQQLATLRQSLEEISNEAAA